MVSTAIKDSYYWRNREKVLAKRRRAWASIKKRTGRPCVVCGEATLSFKHRECEFPSTGHATKPLTVKNHRARQRK